MSQPRTPTISDEERIALRHRRGRKAAHLVAAMPREQGREVMWREIRRLRIFTVADLERATRIGVDTLRSYLQGLTFAGYLSVTGRGQRPPGSNVFLPATYRLERDCGVEAPRVNRKGQPYTQGAGREAQWRAMRLIKRFTLDELVEAASQGTVTVSPVDARDYIKHLQQAGYLHDLGRIGADGARTWSLIPVRNSGPRAPQVQRIQQVFDPNLGRVMWPEGGR